MSGLTTIKRSGLWHKAELTSNGKSRVSIRVVRPGADNGADTVVIPATDISPGSMKDREELYKRVADPAQHEDVRNLIDHLVDDYAVAARDTPEKQADVAPRRGSLIEYEEVAPWEAAVSGSELLDDLAMLFDRHCVLPSGGAYAIALWVLFAWVHDAVQISPKLLVTAPTKRCGKSRVMEVLDAVVPRPLSTSCPSNASIFSEIERSHPTLLLDEAEAYIKHNEELRGLLNSGHTRHAAWVIRMVAGQGGDYEPRKFSTWAATAFSMIGLPPDTVLDRSIVLHLRRKLPTEYVVRWRQDRARETCLSIRRRAARWAAEASALVAEADPDVPAVPNDRQEDNWRPLLAIADAAGGEWPARARRVALELSGQAADEEQPAVQLLGDVWSLFQARGVQHLCSQEIVDYLRSLDDRPWGDWKGHGLSPNGMARMLKSFGIRPKTVRDGPKTPKGYSREDFTDEVARYPSSPTATTATPLRHNDLGASATATRPGCVSVAKLDNSLQDTTVAVVADQLEVDVVSSQNGYPPDWDEVQGVDVGGAT